jgi:hypothetical protein
MKFFFTWVHPEGILKLHFISGIVQITARTTSKWKITTKSNFLAQRILEEICKTQSSPTPSPPCWSTIAQSTETSPGTKPLGIRWREHTALVQRGLRNDITAYSLDNPSAVGRKELKPTIEVGMAAIRTRTYETTSNSRLGQGGRQRGR